MQREQISDLVKGVLATSDLARDNRKYLYQAVCIDHLRKLEQKEENIALFLTLLAMCPRESLVIREAGNIQNVEKKFQASPIIQKKRESYRRKMRGIYGSIKLFFKNL